ncbi:hypothetical protein [Erythrobacter sp.]|jgi:hypothetical protein|uniref:hypothetical protein n=1 Tax=Erythrobacter sp. TaxID=1042 RepID=UPI002EB44D04|nr:hypothetical protein [Erythrobacter sp.]
MKRTAISAAALTLALAACNDQPDEALPAEGELEGALPSVETVPENEAEPELETIGEPEAQTMESGANPPGTETPPAGSKLQKADPDY